MCLGRGDLGSYGQDRRAPIPRTPWWRDSAAPAPAPSLARQDSPTHLPVVPPAATAAPLTQTIDVETPELTVVTYTVAGIGARAYAAAIDFVLINVLLFSLVVMIAAFLPAVGRRGMTSTSIAWAFSAFFFLQFGLTWGYYVLLEALNDGQTVGKRVMRLRVVRDGGLSITFSASATRNFMRIVDSQPAICYLVGMVSALVSKSGKRVGDFAAGTIVVQEDSGVRTSRATAVDPRRAAAAPALHAALTDGEFQLLDQFMTRRMALDVARRTEFAERFAIRFASMLEPAHDGTAMARLARLHEMERTARARGVAGRAGTGAARERHAIIAAGSSRWQAFAATLAKAQRGGLASLGEEGMREFVRDYRVLTGDLARLRTATRGADASELFQLNRLVATAHNLLYRRRTIPLATIVQWLFADIPREIRASWLPIALAGSCMFVPAILVGVHVVQHPAAATAFVPPGMFDRAEDGVRRAKSGDGYIPDPGIFRPVMASQIISNNVQVAIGAFAYGMTGGVLSLYLLVSNGISIGSVFGLYATKGIATLLLAFVAPHGVLELSAIAIAGGGGFLLAAALLIPGARTRRRAFAENGARALRLLGGASLLLLVAGTIEGFISPIPYWPLSLKLCVSGLTAVLLYLYVRLDADGVTPPREPSARDSD